MLKKTRKERNRKKTLNKRLSKNNKKHTFRRKNTKNLTKKNKMLGGHFCIFETKNKSEIYGCNTCTDGTYKFTIPSRYFYYHGNENTLFGFNSHLFKHLDKKKSLINSLNDINFVKTPQNLVLFSLNYDKYPILKKFIDEIIAIITYNRLTYAILKHEIKTNNDNMFTSGPFVNERYKDLMITWSKKPRLPKNNPPLPIKSTVPYTKFVQLHSLSYDGRPDSPVCTPGKILTGDNDVNESQKDNFLATHEQYKNADLTKEPLSDYMQSMLKFKELERQKTEQVKKELERQNEEKARIAAELQRKNQEDEARIAAELQRKKQEAEAEEKKLVCENIEITKSLIIRLNELIIDKPDIKTILVNFNINLDEICHALNDKEGKPINKINAELKAKMNAIITYLKNNGLNNSSTQNNLVSARNNLIKDNNETKNQGLTDLNTILTVFIELKEEAIKAPAARVILNDAPVIQNDARVIQNDAPVIQNDAPVIQNDVKAETVRQKKSSLSRKARRKLVKTGEDLDEDLDEDS